MQLVLRPARFMDGSELRLHLRSIELKSGADVHTADGVSMVTSPDDELQGLHAAFPFSVPAIRALRRLEFTAPVTFFVGDNGTGKSTLLEGIALAASLPAVGLEELSRDETLVAQRQLAHALRLTWHKRTQRGFFLRAEDFFGFARRIAQLRADLQHRRSEVQRDFADASEYVRGLASGPASGSLAALTRRYGENLDARSHGEAFLKLFQSRLVPGGLYLLDEPEAALSPQSQLGLMALMAETVAQQCQYLVATHSPILLAYPGAAIYSFDRTPIEAVRYEDLSHVNLTRDFLNQPARYLRHLLRQDEDQASD